MLATDDSLATIRNLVSKGDSEDRVFFERNGLIYRRWVPRDTDRGSACRWSNWSCQNNAVKQFYILAIASL